MLIRHDAYEKAGGHEAVKDKYCEDMVMARIFKRNGLRPHLLGNRTVLRPHV